jgi:hypothetical protein
MARSKPRPGTGARAGATSRKASSRTTRGSSSRQAGSRGKRGGDDAAEGEEEAKGLDFESGTALVTTIVLLVAFLFVDHARGVYGNGLLF